MWFGYPDNFGYDNDLPYRQSVYIYMKRRLEHIQTLLVMLKILLSVIDKEFIERTELDMIMTLLSIINKVFISIQRRDLITSKQC